MQEHQARLESLSALAGQLVGRQVSCGRAGGHAGGASLPGGKGG